MSYAKIFGFTGVSLVLAATAASGQTLSNAVAEQVMLGNYDPAAYYPAGWTPRKMPYDGFYQEVLAGLEAGISTETLKATLVKLTTFYNRNAGSDTVSATQGIGAARRWALAEFTRMSADAGGRMLPAYLSFTGANCGMSAHRNPMVVMPGMDKTYKGIIVVLGHYDSRCEDACDIACRAHGADDNASGTALVMELARAMSRMPLNRTVVFLLTTGEEQGLHGARAFATYAKDKGIAIHAVQNNDINGGIVCGTAPSQPGCTTPGAIDSTGVRLFSVGDFNSPHKGLARWLKLQYNEKAMPTAKVPMKITLMLPEDRIGRGGDQVPFSSEGFDAIRMIAANENNRTQHTPNDTVLSVPAWWNHLARQVLMNGLGAAMAATGLPKPKPTIVSGSQGVVITVPNAPADAVFRVGIRTANLDFDKLLTWTGPQFAVPNLAVGTQYILSVAQVTNGIESLFSEETRVTPSVTRISEPDRSEVKLWHVRVTPGATGKGAMITVLSGRSLGQALVSVRDAKSKEVFRAQIELKAASQTFTIPAGRIPQGAYTVSLSQGERVLDRVYASLF